MKKKIVNTSGSSLGIRFSLQERELYDIQEGDVVNLDDAIFIKSKKKRVKNDRKM